MRLYWRGKQAETEHMRFPAKVEVKDPLLLRSTGLWWQWVYFQLSIRRKEGKWMYKSNVAKKPAMMASIFF